MLASLGLHGLVLALLALLPAVDRAPRPEIDVVFRPQPGITVPEPVVLPPSQKGFTAARPRPGPLAPPSAFKPAPPLPGDPLAPDDPAVAIVEAPPQKKPGNAGILALKDQFASLAQDKVYPHLGAEARYTDGDDVGRGPSGTALTTNSPGSSGGIDVASLSRRVRGGGGGFPGGGMGGDGQGVVQVGRAESPIARIAGDDRPLSQGGPGPSRTDEEIQIVFDRYKASFYRLYNRELRNDSTLQGQMVLRLTIEPDGSVSMCTLQSTTMNAPQLAVQVVDRVKTINFGAKEGVQALTIVYPIDFLPAA